MKSLEIEIAVARFLNPRLNLIVPNVFWSMFGHELDILVLTKTGYAWEIEIKTSLSDLKKDMKKPHNHYDRRIKHLYFAIPESLQKHQDLIPAQAGIIVVNEQRHCKTIRRPRSNSNPYRFSENERYKIARLGALRIWKLKEKLIQKDISSERQ